MQIEIDKDKIAWFCKKYRIEKLSFFGSVLRADFSDQSDVDVLVDFEKDANWSLIDVVQIQEELGDILFREVDLVERKSIENSENYIRRKFILSNEEVIYVAR